MAVSKLRPTPWGRFSECRADSRRSGFCRSPERRVLGARCAGSRADAVSASFAVRIITARQWRESECASVGACLAPRMQKRAEAKLGAVRKKVRSTIPYCPPPTLVLVVAAVAAPAAATRPTRRPSASAGHSRPSRHPAKPASRPRRAASAPLVPPLSPKYSSSSPAGPLGILSNLLRS